MLGKTALVTGGSRGIGRAIALRLAHEGAQVAFFYAGNEIAAAQTLADIEAAGSKGLAIRCDVGDFTSVQEAFGEVRKAFGPVEIIINNAGITRDGLSLKMQQAAFDDVVRVNLNGAFYVIRNAYEDLIRKRWGRIVNISSVSGLMGNPGQINYSAAKAGMIGLTKTIARELAGRGVTCNAVAPGFIATDMTDQMTDQAKNLALQNIPMKRMGMPEDIAAAVAFLCSEQAAYITGAVLQVDGGLYM